MENAREVIAAVRDSVSQHSASRKDEITVMKAIINDPEYSVDVYDKDGKLLRDAKDKGSTYTFENLINNTNYKVKLTCHSDEFGDASSSEETSTTKLNAPIIRCNDTNAEVDFNNRSINNLVKEIKVNDALYNGTIYNVTHVNIINFATDQRPDTVKIEASVKADDGAWIKFRDALLIPAIISVSIWGVEQIVDKATAAE